MAWVRYTIVVRNYQGREQTEELDDKILDELEDKIQQAVAMVAINNGVYIDVNT